MFDITTFRSRHRCVATFLDMVKSTLIASMPHPPNTSTTKGMHDHPLRADASSLHYILPTLSYRMFLVTCFMDFCSYDFHAKDIQYHGSCQKSCSQILNKHIPQALLFIVSL